MNEFISSYLKLYIATSDNMGMGCSIAFAYLRTFCGIQIMSIYKSTSFAFNEITKSKSEKNVNAFLVCLNINNVKGYHRTPRD